MDTGAPPRRRLRVYPGWVFVGAAAVFGAFNVGGAVFATSVFAVPMQEELDWGQGVLYGALSLRLVGGGLLGPLTGPLADHRWALRVFLPAGVVLLGLSFLMLRWVQSPLEYFFWYGLVGALGTAAVSTAVLEAVVSKWFVRKRSRALMWFQIGPPTGPLVFPLILVPLIAQVGWRDAWLLLGVTTMVVLLPLALLIRPRPEDLKLQPDGFDAQAGVAVRSSVATLPHEEVSFTRRQAIHTPAFWLLTLAMALGGGFGVPGYQAHWVPYFREVGFNPSTAAAAVTVYAFFALSSRFVWGFFSARYPTQRVIVVQSACAAAAVLLILVVQNPALLFLWAVLQGLTLAGFFQLQALIAANYFGRRYLGSIRGAMWVFSVIASALGPVALSGLRQWQGSYQVAFLAVAAAWSCTAILVWKSRPPRKPEAAPASGAGMHPLLAGRQQGHEG